MKINGDEIKPGEYKVSISMQSQIKNEIYEEIKAGLSENEKIDCVDVIVNPEGEETRYLFYSKIKKGPVSINPSEFKEILQYYHTNDPLNPKPVKLKIIYRFKKDPETYFVGSVRKRTN